ncbi:MAG TPA: hypothetical protein VN107_00750 [Microbacterium sp.]|nr:hypothetical protein [Microbacterium sp.]
MASSLAGSIAVLALSACAATARPDAHATAGTSATPSAVVSPTSSARPAQTPTRTTATATPKSTPKPTPTTTAGITLDGIGRFTLGGSFAAAGKALGATPYPECRWIVDRRGTMTTWVGAKHDGTAVTDVIDLVAIDSWGLARPPANPPRTATGITLGSSRAAVEAAYPAATVVKDPNAQFALRYVAGGRSLVFEGRDGVVRSIQLLAAPDAVPSEYCG